MFSSSYGRAGRVLLAAASALAVLLLADVSDVHAQQGTVTGQVVDASSLEPVVGAQVFFPDLDLGTLTNEEGRYRITGVPAGSQRIRVRLLGYRPTTRNVTVEGGQTATADFQLSVSAVSLGEIVVTQTGERETREIGTAVSTIDAASEVERSRPQTVQDLIKGKATSTVIRSSSGSVGTTSNINIRGLTSLTLNNTPLIYIDGVRVSNDQSSFEGFSGAFFTGGQETSRINDLNPEDIESIQVLKGPSATTLYGSEAASGVLVIETKSGRAGDTRWTGRTDIGGNWDSTDWHTSSLDGTQSLALIVGPALAPLAKDTIYDMNLLQGQAGIASPFRTGLEQNYAGTVRGGFAEGNVSYYISGEYDQQEGNLPTNSVEKWNGRLNMNISPSEDIDISLSNGYTANATRLPQNDNNAVGYIGNAFLGLTFQSPFRRADIQEGGAPVNTCPSAFEIDRAGLGPALSAALGLGLPASQADNLGVMSSIFCGAPFFALSFDDINLVNTSDDTERFTSSARLDFRPTDFLTSRVTVGYDESDTAVQQLWPVTPRLSGTFQDFIGFISKQKGRQSNLTLQTTQTARFDVTDELESSTTAGAQYFDETTDATIVQCREFPAGSPACANSVEQVDIDDFFVSERTLGLFAEQQFSWRNRLFVTAGVRFDENSAFGDELGLTGFPRASLSYVMSDEEWFPEFFDQFKLRSAWGHSGKQPPTNSAFDLQEAVFTPINGTETLGVTRDQPGNPDLSPARVKEIEVGIDASFLEGRVSSSITWYRQTTTDDIVERPLPGSAGFEEDRFVNIGELTNTGVETTLSATALSMPDFTWDWQAQVSTNYNEVTELATPVDVSGNQRHAEGQPLAAWFDRDVTVASNGAINVTPGRVFVGGDPTPNVNGSLSSTMTLFNHVTLHALGEFSTGHQISFDTGEFGCAFAGITACAEVFELNPATGEISTEARVKATGAAEDTEDPWIEDADNLVLRTVSLRFDLPQSWTQFFSARNVAISVIGENLVTFTGYEGHHPEVNGFAAPDGGATSSFLTLPPGKRVTAGVSVSF